MQRNKHLLLWSSAAALLLLIVAAVQENLLKDWRRLQREARSPARPLEVRLRQVVVPALRATDRCVSCHVGMAAGEPSVPGDPALRPHPDVVHDPASFGCTVCHGGQGRASEKADAHGDVHFWPQPMIPRRHADAGCGSCHTHLRVPNLDRLRAGAAAFERHDCFACHRLDGRGGTLRPEGGGVSGPDLSRAGATGYREGWYGEHLAHKAKEPDGAWGASFAPVSESDRRDLDVLLSSRVGAPGLVLGKALFHTFGCRGCHKVGGVGGDDGPDLTLVGQKDPGLLDFKHVPGGRSLASWFAEHFRAPAAVVPGSLMPALGLSEAEIESLTHYMLSLRRSEVPEAFWPKDRIRAERFSEREFARDGATLYGSFCAACHGRNGEGMRYPGMPPFPAIANRDFLELVSDAFLTENVRHGRPGRRMPAWGEKAGGLDAAEIALVVGHVRTLGGGVNPARDARPARWIAADAALGKSLYATHCALCHGEKGQGAEGPALDNAVLLRSASDTYLVETIRRGRRDTTMPSFLEPTVTRAALSQGEIEAIVAFLRTWEPARLAQLVPERVDSVTPTAAEPKAPASRESGRRRRSVSFDASAGFTPALANQETTRAEPKAPASRNKEQK
jgi:cbb3-type cytochrome c oxidase subunit III